MLVSSFFLNRPRKHVVVGLLVVCSFDVLPRALKAYLRTLNGKSLNMCIYVYIYMWCVRGSYACLWWLVLLNKCVQWISTCDQWFAINVEWCSNTTLWVVMMFRKVAMLSQKLLNRDVELSTTLWNGSRGRLRRAMPWCGLQAAVLLGMQCEISWQERP